MTNHEINKISNKVAELVISALEEKQKEWDSDLVQELKTFEPPMHNTAEQKLLTDLAEAMTALDYNLKLERYDRCSQLQKEITEIENQLKQF